MEKDLRELMIRILNDTEMRLEMIEVLKLSITSKDVSDGLVELFEVGFKDPRMKKATKELL